MESEWKDVAGGGTAHAEFWWAGNMKCRLKGSQCLWRRERVQCERKLDGPAGHEQADSLGSRKESLQLVDGILTPPGTQPGPWRVRWEEPSMVGNLAPGSEVWSSSSILSIRHGVTFGAPGRVRGTPQDVLRSQNSSHLQVCIVFIRSGCSQ